MALRTGCKPAAVVCATARADRTLQEQYFAACRISWTVAQVFTDMVLPSHLLPMFGRCASRVVLVALKLGMAEDAILRTAVTRAQLPRRWCNQFSDVAREQKYSELLISRPGECDKTAKI